MPFDRIDPRGSGGGHDPAPAWDDRLTAWIELAAMLAANAMILLLIALWGVLGVVTADVDCAGMAVFTALVTAPFHLSWGRVRELAAGRWP